MEHFILGMLQEHLGKYIVGFRKEMVNASLLNGKGEIADLSLNCAAINQELCNIVPFIELDSIHISKVAFQVTSWTNLRKAPIMVDIEHVTINISEPLHYLDPRKRRRVRQMSVAEMEQHFSRLAEEAKKSNTSFNNPNKRGSYSLADRIADNLMIEIKSIFIQFQTWGTFKTRRPGPWTPPTIQILLRNFRYCSVDEFGQEGTPDENWAHNHKSQPRGQEKTLLILKKLSMDFDFGIRTVDGKGLSLLTGGRGGGVQPPGIPSSTTKATEAPPSPKASASQAPTAQPSRSEPPKTAESLVAELAMDTNGPSNSTLETISNTDAVLAAAIGEDVNVASTVSNEPLVKDSALAPTTQNSEDIIKQTIATSDLQEQGCVMVEATKYKEKIPMGFKTFTMEEAHRNFAAAANDAKTDVERTEDNRHTEFKCAGTTDSVEEDRNRVLVHMATKRRVRDGALLALQVDNTLSNVGIVIPAEAVHHLVHLTVGIHSCFCKDRGFEDPLRSKNDLTDHNDARSDQRNSNKGEKHKEEDTKDDDQEAREENASTPTDDEIATGTLTLEVSSSSESIEVASTPAEAVEGVATIFSKNMKPDNRSKTTPDIQDVKDAPATIGRVPIIGNTSVSGDRLFVPETTASSEKITTNETGDTILQVAQAEDKSKNVSKSITSFFSRRPSVMSTQAKSAAANEDTPKAFTDTAVAPSSTLDLGEDRAIVMLPYGLVIHEKISLSVSIERATCRGVVGYSNSTGVGPGPSGDPEGKGKNCSSSKLGDFHSNEYLYSHDDYFQLNAKGVVLELIWPKVDLKRGGYVQASISHVSIQERVGGRKRILMSGGTRFDPFDVKKSVQPEETKELFPLFQNRFIREDPLDKHHVYPAQAIGFIATIACNTRTKTVPSALNSVSTSGMITTSASEEDPIPTPEMIHKVSPETELPEKREEKTTASGREKIADTFIKVTNDVGIDNFNVVLNCLSWCRILRFILNESSGGFDPRWLSGDWAAMFTTAMLVHPNSSLDLGNHLQPVRNKVLEDEFISSDLISINAKITNCEFCIPAAIQHSVQSCEIVVAVRSLLLKISSDLPQPLMSANVGRSFCDADSNEVAEKVCFPNDITDFSTVETARKEKLTDTSNTKSTFRLEFELGGLSTQIVPVIPSYKATKPQQFCTPTSLKFSVGFEGEQVETEASSPLKMIIHSSLVFDQISVNCDLDLLAGAIKTCLHHYQIVKETFECLTNAMAPMTTDPLPVENNCIASDVQDTSGGVASSGTNKNSGMKNSNGSLLHIHRQIHRSREAGELRAAFFLKVTAFDFCLWRKNVSISDPLHRGDSSADGVGRKKTFFPLLKIFALSARSVEVGLEVDYQEVNRRGVAKGSIAEVRFSLGNFNAATTTTTTTTVGALKEVDDGLKTKASREGDAAILRKNDICEANREHSEMEGDLGATKNSSDDDSVARKNLKKSGNAGLSHREDEHENMINLFSFGPSSPTDGAVSQTGHAILLRYEEYLSVSRSRSFAADFGDGGVVEFHAEYVETAFLLVLEALMMPIWSGVSVNPTFEQRRFPVETIGSFSLSLVPSSDAKLSSWLESVSKKLAVAFPPDLRLLLLRIRMGGLRIALPALGDQVDPKAEKCELDLRCFDLTTWFVSPEGDFHRELLSVVSNARESWSACISNESPGVQHTFHSRQSISLTMPHDSSSQSAVVIKIVPEFEVKLDYIQAKLSVSMGNTLSFRNTEMTQRCFQFLQCFTERCITIYERAKEQLMSIGDMEPAHKKTDGFDETSRDRCPHPSRSVYADIVQSVQAAKHLLSRMTHCFHEKEYDRLLVLREKDAILEQLQRQVFEKERERLAAIALASSPIAGWLRMGNSHQSGQRVSSTSTLWRYWAVLRIDMIVVYSSPGKYNPVDFVSLRGAAMHPLAGGGSKWDLKRAFGIVEKNGTSRFFVAETTDEFIGWTREIEKVIKFYKAAAEAKSSFDTFIDTGKTNLCIESTGIESAGLGAVGSVHSVQEADTLTLQTDKLAMGRLALSDKEEDSLGAKAPSSIALANGGVPVAKTVTTADSKGQRSDVLRKFNPMRDQHHSSPATNPSITKEKARTRNTDRLQLRGKVTEMGQATSRWGSALLSATRQTGKAVAEKARRGTNSPSNKDECSNSNNENGRGTWACPICTFSNSTREFETEILFCDMCTSPTKMADVEVEEDVEEHFTTTVSHEDANAADPSDIPKRKELVFADIIDPGNTTHTLSAGTADDVGRVNAADSSSRGFERTESASAFHEDAAEDEVGSIISNLAVGDQAEANRSSSLARAAGRLSMGATLGNSRRSQESMLPEGEKKTWLSRLGSNISSQQEDTGSFQATQPSLKLKHIRIASIDLTVDENLPLAHPPLAKLDGQCYVLVREVESCSSIVDIDETSSEKETLKTAPSSLCFCIKTFHLVGHRKKVDAPTSEIVRSFSDILCFHALLSECISHLVHHPFFHEKSCQGMDNGDMSAGFSDARGKSPLDIVRLSGALLAGTVDSLDSVLVDTLSSYNVIAVTDFLNFSLQCPLPRAALLSLSDLLGIAMTSREVWAIPDNFEQETLQKISPPRYFDDAINVSPEQRTKTADSEALEQVGLVEVDPENILALSDKCITELMSVEQNGKIAAGLAVVQTSRQIPSVCVFPGSVLPNDITEHLREAVHSALMKVMAERDEVRAQLVSTNVMRMHALEQERKKTARLTAKLEDLRSKLQQKKGGPLFGGSEKNRKVEQEGIKEQEKQEKMRQSFESEILMLCRQLSCEISSSRKASLEVMRLQEIGDIERQLGDSERAALEIEIVRMKEMLAQEKQKVQENQSEAKKWRQRYENITGTCRELP